MISLDDVGIAVIDDPTVVIVPYLKHDDAVIRCAAAKVLGVEGNVEAAPILVEALLDEDPDVRADAMEALIHCARPEDAPAIRCSLQGDPVQEVKVFAIEALARLDDRASIPLLRALAKDRTDADVAWEDDAGMWDDWLDVQAAAIKALGRLQASEAIDDLLDARADEMGQELDAVVFATLAEIEDGGLAALFALLRDRDAKVRERVIRALSKARPEAMLPMQAILLRDASPRVRRLAIDTLSPDDQAVTDLILHDTDSNVRAAALSAFAEARPDLVMAALRDPDEDVLAIAVGSLPANLEASIADDVAANLQAWMETAGPVLSAAAATALPKVTDRQAADADGLFRLASKVERPIEARMAALQALADVPSESVIETLGERVADPVRQIRTAALAALSAIARRREDPHRDAAEAILAAAIRGELGTDVDIAKDDPSAGTDDVGATKVEGGKGRVTISPDGEIVTRDEAASDDLAADNNVIEGLFPTSTLDAIQVESTTGPSGGEVAHPGAGGPVTKRRRVAVDGLDDVGQDIRIVALGMIGDCGGETIDQALLDSMECEDHAVRVAAFRAVAKRSETTPLAPAMIDVCRIALADADAAIRSSAATIIGRSASDAPNLLSAQAADSDPIVRDAVLKAIAKIRPETALDALRDPSPVVRRTAMELLIASANKDALEQGIDICLAEGKLDALRDGCKRCPEIRTGVLNSIGHDGLTKPQLRMALETLALA